MRAFNFTKEEKRPYWEDAREYIRASGLPLELDYTAFGICPEGAYVYVLPQKKGKKTQELWELAKQKIRGIYPGETGQAGTQGRCHQTVCPDYYPVEGVSHV